MFSWQVRLNVLLSHMSLGGQKLFRSVAMPHRLKDGERVVKETRSQRIDIRTTKSRTAHTAQNAASEMHINTYIFRHTQTALHTYSYLDRKIAHTRVHTHAHTWNMRIDHDAPSHVRELKPQFALFFRWKT